MNKYYVPDTNALLYSPQAIFAFNEHAVIIPEGVLDELDRFKSEATERGTHCRQVSRINCLDTSPPCYRDNAKADNLILPVCMGLSEQDRPTVLVSRNDRPTALERFDDEKVVHLKYQNRNPFGVLPRNIGQVFVQA